MKTIPSFISIVLVFLTLMSCTNSASTGIDEEFEPYILSYEADQVSVTGPINIQLKQEVTQFKIGSQLPTSIVSISPNTTVETVLESPFHLKIYPKNPLKANQSYTISLNLSALYKSIPAEVEVFTYPLTTRRPEFKLSQPSYQSYDQTWGYLEASIELSDQVNREDLVEVITAQQNQNSLHINWLESNEQDRFFRFKVDSIQRLVDASKVTITWDGSPIKSEQQGDVTVDISPLQEFKVLSVNPPVSGQKTIVVNFSSPLDEDQNFAGLISLGSQQDLDVSANGNNLTIYLDQPKNSEEELRISRTILSTYDENLSQDFVQTIPFKRLKPAVRLISKATILPNSNQNPFYFEAVNLKAVDLRIIKIYEDNVLRFLQQNNLSSSNIYRLREYGKTVTRASIPLVSTEIDNDGTWKAHAIDLNQFISTEPGAIYQIQLSFRPSLSLYNCSNTTPTDFSYTPLEELDGLNAKEDAYYNNQRNYWKDYTYNWQERDNPCHDAYYNDQQFVATNVLASNLGLSVKTSANGQLHIAANHLVTAQPIPNVELQLYDFQLKRIDQITTNTQGFAHVKLASPVAFVQAKSNQNYAYLNLEENKALSLSQFDVSGQEVKKGIQGYMYNDRGVYRPGDTIYSSFVLDDHFNPLPDEHPVTLKVFNAQGKLVHQDLRQNSVHKFYRFDIPTSTNAVTGNWRAQISLGAIEFEKRIRVAAVKPNRLKIELDHDELITPPLQPLNFTLSTEWLSGATARNLKATVEANMSVEAQPFKKYTDYQFTNPTLSFTSSTLQLFEGKVNQVGTVNISKSLQLNRQAPGMIKLDILSKVFENGGDFSIDVDTKYYAPFTYFVGIKTPELSSNGYETDKDIPFQLKVLNYKGETASSRNLDVKVYKIDWHWWWNRGSDNLSRYRSSSNRRLVKSYQTTTNAKGNAVVNISIPERERGRYYIEVQDQSGHSSGVVTYFFKNWWSEDTGNLSQMLVFSSDKETYEVGETATITFPSSANARALLTVENGSEVLLQKWVTTKAGSTTTPINLEPKMAPNCYVSISLIQPHQQTENDRPMRLFGVIPLQVNNQNSKLNPLLETPEVVKPETDYQIRIKEADGLPMTYTLAIVDEGLLDLTNYQTPDIHAQFNAKQALGVQTFDVFDDVIGAYAGSVNTIFSVGGGGEAAAAKNKKANRFEPVVTYLGPFHLKPNSTKTHKLHMPNYVGRVKAMLVAGDVQGQAYGSTEQSMQVKKPLMLLASGPRAISPQETISVPVTVFALEPSLKQVSVKAQSTSGLELIGSSTRQLQFSSLEEQVVVFNYKVKTQTGIEQVNFTAKSKNESASYSIAFNAFNPNDVEQSLTSFKLEPGQEISKTIEAFGTPGTQQAYIEFSNLPPIDLKRRINQLIDYPHGCVEQQTSKAFPQLYVPLMTDVSQQEQQNITANVSETIRHLGELQLLNGALPYWEFGDADEWCTTYAGHFMIEAKTQGYNLPPTFLSQWINFQKKKASTWQYKGNVYTYQQHLQAYRLFSLALAGEPNLAAMNKLRTIRNLTAEAKWRLASAYAMIGQKAVAEDLVANLDLKFSNSSSRPYYGSSFRNQAMALESLILLQHPEMEVLAEKVALKLSSTNWLSTHETAYALLAMAKLMEANGGKGINVNYSINNSEEQVQSSKNIAYAEVETDLKLPQTLKASNPSSKTVYVRYIQEGQPGLEPSPSVSQNLKLKASYFNSAKEPINIGKLRQGTEVTLDLTLTNPSATSLENVAVRYLVPSGWEILNTSFTDFKSAYFKGANYVDFRDRELLIYVDLPPNSSQSFSVSLVASFLGSYYLPSATAQTMYSDNYFAKTRARWVEVVE